MHEYFIPPHNDCCEVISYHKFIKICLTKVNKILEKICSRLMSVYFGFQFMDFAVAVVMLVAVVTTQLWFHVVAMVACCYVKASYFWCSLVIL